MVIFSRALIIGLMKSSGVYPWPDNWLTTKYSTRYLNAINPKPLIAYSRRPTGSTRRNHNRSHPNSVRGLSGLPDKWPAVDIHVPSKFEQSAPAATALASLRRGALRL